ncbi:MAG TPA: transcriptional regulator NrdR [Gaiellales bacterium]|jgi:transcriptional repressor NrdR|nr:transcriptional regulator NrdR [Gaiellales bacterium]
MICPTCGVGETRVLESRVSDAGEAIRRRRECLACQARFTTFERLEQSALWVVKRDGSRQPFDHSKLLRGLERACVKRPIALDLVERIVAAVEAGFRSDGLSEVPSEAIGEAALLHLRDLDGVAYIRFASVYRSFETPDEFQNELESLDSDGRTRVRSPVL